MKYLAAFSSQIEENIDMYSKQELKDYLEWDEYTWSKALYAWDEILDKKKTNKDLNALELGGRNGGLTLYLAQKGIKTTCSDYGSPTGKAKELHKKHNVTSLVEYSNIDASKINYPDNFFDIVVFKSILGAVTSQGRTENLGLVSLEIYRILKPGGHLIFAENMKASTLHTLARKWFIPWGAKWHYLSKEEINNFVSPFSEVKLDYFGFLGAFVKIKVFKKFIYYLDSFLNLFLPDSFKYVSYGWARK